MKKILALALATVMSLSLVACSSSSQSTTETATSTTTTTTTTTATADTAETEIDFEPIVMKLAHYATETHPGGVAAQQFADEIAEKTGGDITIEIYPNNELGDPAQILEQNILGVVDMSLPTQGSLDKYSKKFATVMFPFVFESYEHAYAVLDGAFNEWVEDDLLDQGLVFIGSWDYGFRCLTNSAKAIESAADVSGLAIRTPGEVQLQACMEALGANVQTIAFNDLYLSLMQNTVDGQENPLSVIYENKYYEAQDYLAITNHVYNCMNLVISEAVWATLPTEYQDIITEASANAAATMRQMTQEGEATYIELLEAEGMIVTYPDQSEFAALMEPAYATINEYIGNEEYAETFLQMVEDYRP